jgi:hypothetical protein
MPLKQLLGHKEEVIRQQPRANFDPDLVFSQWMLGKSTRGIIK